MMTPKRLREIAESIAHLTATVNTARELTALADDMESAKGDGITERERLIREGLSLDSTGRQHYCEESNYLIGVIDTIRWDRKLMRDREAWQPIATAPTDGTLVMIGRESKEWGGFLRGIGYYSSTPLGDAGDVVGWVSTCASCAFNRIDGFLRIGHPTHWRPMPDPPEL